ncbi:hypothetical protein ERIC1_2c00180 [Paenibacillus larvae subsp. larvae DSM 25719]|nr:hypothetical protein ERIC1_2c00180 [Paenibacillus larvae subsp. larvae DSM 25719]
MATAKYSIHKNNKRLGRITEGRINQYPYGSHVNKKQGLVLKPCFFYIYLEIISRQMIVSKKTIGDPITDLYEDIAAEEKARATYQWLIDMTDDVDLQDGLKFLREREIVHSLRFREAVEILKAERDAQHIF